MRNRFGAHCASSRNAPSHGRTAALSAAWLVSAALLVACGGQEPKAKPTPTKVEAKADENKPGETAEQTPKAPDPADTKAGAAEAGEPAAAEAGEPAAAEAGAEAGGDAGAEGAAEAGAGAEAGAEAGEDAGAEAGAEAGEDAGAEAGAEAGEDAGEAADDGAAAADGGGKDAAALIKEARTTKTTDERALEALAEAEAAGSTVKTLGRAAKARGDYLYKDPDRAKVFYEYAMAKDEDYPEPVFALAKQKAVTGDLEDVVKLLKQVAARKGGKKLLEQIDFDPTWDIVKDDPDVRALL